MTGGARGGLSSRLTKYGDSGFANFLRESFLKAQGLGEEALSRPVVGICGTASDFNPCHATSPKLIEAASRGVMMAGGIPFVFPTISLHESFSYPSSMFLRNLMSMDTEEMMKSLPLDATLLIGGCDKTVPAQLMGAISADVPTVSVVVGPMLTGNHEGERLGACTDCRRLWGEKRANTISDAELARAQVKLMPTHGTCMVMGTASTMACISEAMGFMLPGGASIPAVHSERLHHAELSGQRAVEMAKTGAPLPTSMMTPASLKNASITLQALGGSTNAVIHLSAIAGRAGLMADLEEFDAIGRETPILADLKPVGRVYMQDFHKAGGLPALLRELVRGGVPFDTDAQAGDGRSWGDVLENWPTWTDPEVIRPVNNPVRTGQAISVLQGNLAPNGAIIKEAAMSDNLRVHEGAALVFDSLADLEARIDDPDLPVTAKTVLVLRNAGPIGGPGMPEAGSIPIPKKLAVTGVRDMVRISDARMSGTAYGAVVLHVSPEASAGGTLALVRDGDRILLDVPKRRLELLVEDAELDRRRGEWAAPELPERGYARLYASSVTQAHLGCDFDFLSGKPQDKEE